LTEEDTDVEDADTLYKASRHEVTI
jgi:hypothetical protein